MSDIIISSGTVSYMNSAGEWVPLGVAKESKLQIDTDATQPQKAVMPKLTDKWFTMTVGGTFTYKKREMNRLLGMILLWHRRN